MYATGPATVKDFDGYQDDESDVLQRIPGIGPAEVTLLRGL